MFGEYLGFFDDPQVKILVGLALIGVYALTRIYQRDKWRRNPCYFPELPKM